MARPPRDGTADNPERAALSQHLAAEFEQQRVLNSTSVEEFDSSGVVIAYKALNLDLIEPIVPSDHPEYQVQRQAMIDRIFDGYAYRITGSMPSTEGQRVELRYYQRLCGDGHGVHTEWRYKTEPNGRKAVVSVELLNHQRAAERQKTYERHNRTGGVDSASRNQGGHVSSALSKHLIRAAGFSAAETKLLDAVYGGGIGRAKGGEALRAHLRRWHLRRRVVHDMFADESKALDDSNRAVRAMDERLAYEAIVEALGINRHGDTIADNGSHRIARERIERLRLISVHISRIRFLNLLGIRRDAPQLPEQSITSTTETENGVIAAQLIHEYQLVRSGSWRRTKRSRAPEGPAE